MLWRGFVIWLIIILAESLNGTVRVLLLEQHFGVSGAKRITLFTAMAIILTIAITFIGWVRAKSLWQLLVVGGLWALLTFAFELVLGRYVLDYSWEKIFADYDLNRGGLMFIGLIYLTFVPLLAAIVRKQSGESKTPYIAGIGADRKNR